MIKQNIDSNELGFEKFNINSKYIVIYNFARVAILGCIICNIYTYT